MGIFVPAAKRDAALRQVFADRDFFLKPSAPDARENPRFDARPVPAGNYAFLERRPRPKHWLRRRVG